YGIKMKKAACAARLRNSVDLKRFMGNCLCDSVWVVFNAQSEPVICYVENESN
ncbi:MAG: hypothetical protein ACI9WR_001082, partial [Paracoccaceae bacterium]